MPADPGMAVAAGGFVPGPVKHVDAAAPDVDQSLVLELGEHRGDVGPTDAEHPGEHDLGDRQGVGADPVLQAEEPAQHPLLDGMGGVAGDRLQHLGEQAVGVAHEQVVQRRGGALGLAQPLRIHAQDRALDLDHALGEGGQVAVADDAAHRALATDRGGLDRSVAAHRHQQGGDGPVQGEGDVRDVLADPEQHVTPGMHPSGEMRR